MKLISTITADAKQSMGIILDDGSTVTVSLVYKKRQRGWFYSVSYPMTPEPFIDYNRRMVVSPNMLRAFRNIIPFGLACVTADGYEPIYITDFTNGRAQLYILNSADVASVESKIINA